MFIRTGQIQCPYQQVRFNGHTNRPKQNKKQNANRNVYTYNMPTDKVVSLFVVLKYHTWGIHCSSFSPMNTCMQTQMTQSGECFVTAITKERFQSGVCTLMSVQITAFVETPVTIITYEGLPASMNAGIWLYVFLFRLFLEDQTPWPFQTLTIQSACLKHVYARMTPFVCRDKTIDRSRIYIGIRIYIYIYIYMYICIYIYM